ncbi:hypothetical protein SAMN02745702_01269 [Desulfobaculum bizertense DSM 18034]|uniref:Uncharacterized protein n=1 Tax=Desulfobaculum bizertense DSM 18034 TaxID=1121442 RepID=A0A1T4VYF8_9BACT|nr:hypothetical protein SAMN02745702_01269 [Desulfobaculum bizertense DSM 18034]
MNLDIKHLLEKPSVTILWPKFSPSVPRFKLSLLKLFAVLVNELKSLVIVTVFRDEERHTIIVKLG